jgi:antitoxin VapB
MPAYALDQKERKMITASVFKNGANRAIRIPKALEFDADEVQIERDGERLIITPIFKPKMSWAEFAKLPPVSDDFMLVRETQMPIERESLD